MVGDGRVTLLMTGLKSRTARILIVEDDGAFRAIVEEVLKRQGHLTQAVATAETALERLRSDHFDLMVLDMTLPGMLGDQLLERLHESAEVTNVAVIAMSAFRLESERQTNLRQRFGVQGFLHKPFPLVELLHAVATALDERAVPVHWNAAPTSQAPPAQSTGAPPSDDKTAGTDDRPVLTVDLSSPADFLREFATNIASAGLFVAAAQPLPLRTPVKLAIRAPVLGEHAEREIMIDAEVVYCRDEPGRGVGVQFSTSPESLSSLKSAAAAARAALRAGRPLRLAAAVSLPLAWEIGELLPGAQIEVMEPASGEGLAERMLPEPPDVLFIEAEADGSAASRVAASIRARPEFAATSIFVVGPEASRSGALAGGPEAYFAFPEEKEVLARVASASFERAQVREIRVPLRAWVRLHMGELTLDGDCLDLSLGGVSMALKAKLDVGQKMEIELAFKDGSLPMHGTAEVAWAQEDRLTHIWRLGLAFRQMPPDVRVRLHERIFFALQAATDPYLRQVATPFEQAQRQQVRVAYRGEVRIHVGGATVYAEGVDISIGGVAVTVRAKLTRGQYVNAEIVLSDGHAPLVCNAQVVWVHDEPESGLSRIGLRFEGMNDAGLARLRAYAAQTYRTPTPMPLRVKRSSIPE
jgi:CheY-like chemotaxis protein/c-di-GMP-binding flagellar brake protein YcgR